MYHWYGFRICDIQWPIFVEILQWARILLELIKKFKHHIFTLLKQDNDWGNSQRSWGKPQGGNAAVYLHCKALLKAWFIITIEIRLELQLIYALFCNDQGRHLFLICTGICQFEHWTQGYPDTVSTYSGTYDHNRHL